MKSLYRQPVWHSVRFWRLVVVGCALAGLSGCGSTLLNGEQSQQTYILDARPAHPPTAAAGPAVLLVASPQAEPGFDTPRIAYTKAPSTLDYFTRSSWVDTPARMLQPLIVQALEDTQAFKAVLAIPASTPPNLRLDFTLIRLQQEFMQQPSRERLTARVKLIDVATGHILATQLFEAVETASSEDAYGGVQAANRAVAQLLGEIAAFVLHSMPQTTAPR